MVSHYSIQRKNQLHETGTMVLDTKKKNIVHTYQTGVKVATGDKCTSLLHYNIEYIVKGFIVHYSTKILE